MRRLRCWAPLACHTDAPGNTVQACALASFGRVLAWGTSLAHCGRPLGGTNVAVRALWTAICAAIGAELTSKTPRLAVPIGIHARDAVVADGRRGLG